MRLAAAVEDGALTFAAASDLIVDVGLQAKMREVLGVTPRDPVTGISDSLA